MQKSLLFSYFMLYACTATASYYQQHGATQDPADTLLNMMIGYRQQRATDYAIYNHVVRHPELLQRVIKKDPRQTFAMICLNTGRHCLLQEILEQNYTVDLTTPCEKRSRFNKHRTLIKSTVLTSLFHQLDPSFVQDKHSWKIVNTRRLAQVIIQRHPELLNITEDNGISPRNLATQLGLSRLLPQQAIHIGPYRSAGTPATVFPHIAPQLDYTPEQATYHRQTTHHNVNLPQSHPQYAAPYADTNRNPSDLPAYFSQATHPTYHTMRLLRQPREYPE